MDTTTEVIEHKVELERGTLTPNSTDMGKPFPGAESSHSFPPGHPTTEKHLMMSQRVVGAKDMRETDMKVGDDGPGDPLHKPGESHASDDSSPVDGEAMPGTAIEAAVKYPKDQTQIKPKVLMSCTLCTYKTTKKISKKRLYNHRRRKHPRDSNTNPKEDMHDLPDGVTRKKAQRDHKEKVPDPPDGDDANVLDTACVEDSENDSCMVIHGDKEWVKDCEKMSVGSVRSGEEEDTAPANEGHMEEEVDTIDRVVVGHDGDMPADMIDLASPTDNTKTGDSGTDENAVACDIDDSSGHVNAPGTREGHNVPTGVDQPEVEEVVH